MIEFWQACTVETFSNVHYNRYSCNIMKVFHRKRLAVFNVKV